MNMKGFTVVIFGMAIQLLAGIATESRAEVNLNIGINAGPPAYVIPAPPPVVVIPGTYVYYAPGLKVDILFYHGYWYRPHGSHWYRARSHNGPWSFVSPGRVPRPLVALPHDYRHVQGREHIPYGQLKKNWKRWEQERHWDARPDRPHGPPGPNHGREGRDGDRDRGHGRRG